MKFRGRDGYARNQLEIFYLVLFCVFISSDFMFSFLYILFPFLLRFVLAWNWKFVYGFAEWECWKLTPLGC